MARITCRAARRRGLRRGRSGQHHGQYLDASRVRDGGGQVCRPETCRSRNSLRCGRPQYSPFLRPSIWVRGGNPIRAARQSARRSPCIAALCRRQRAGHRFLDSPQRDTRCQGRCCGIIWCHSASFWVGISVKTSNKMQACARAISPRNHGLVRTSVQLTKAIGDLSHVVPAAALGPKSRFRQKSRHRGRQWGTKALKGPGASSGANWCTLRGGRRLRHQLGRGAVPDVISRRNIGASGSMMPHAG